MYQFIIVVAEDIAAAAIRWATTKAVDYVASHAADWVSEGVDWLVERVTGKSREQWDAGDKALALAALEAEGLGKKDWSLAQAALTFLRSRKGADFLARWQSTIDEESGATEQLRRRLIDLPVIPREQSIYQWAADVAAKLGVTRDYVINRRKASV